MRHEHEMILRDADYSIQNLCQNIIDLQEKVDEQEKELGKLQKDIDDHVCEE